MFKMTSDISDISLTSIITLPKACVWMKKTTRELFAEARAIHLAMQNGAVAYVRARELVQPLLTAINSRARRIARKHRVVPKEIKFQDLGREL